MAAEEENLGHFEGCGWYWFMCGVVFIVVFKEN